MRSFTIVITDFSKTNKETELAATEDNYDFYLDALIVAQSVTGAGFIDENRVALAKGEVVSLETPQCYRSIMIREEN